jgi:RNA polymerase sigma-70 factor (ECF subfamily)
MASRPSLRELDEEQLVEHFRSSGDNRFFEELYRRSRRRVFGACLRILEDIQWAEDVCHDAFIRAYDRFTSLEGVSFSAWVRRIATNLALNGLRHRSVVARTPPEVWSSAAASGSAEERVVSAQHLDIAEAIIEQLDGPQRRVFLLRHLDELSYEKIAAATGYSRQQVRSYLQNARRNFRLEWQRRTGYEEGASDGRR